jgi:hypothetical protein
LRHLFHCHKAFLISAIMRWDYSFELSESPMSLHHHTSLPVAKQALMTTHSLPRKAFVIIVSLVCLGPFRAPAEATEIASCDELKFQVSSCMLFNGTNTMSACQSCVYSALNKLATASSASASSAPAGEASPAAAAATCEQLNELMCETLHTSCHDTCRLGACYNSTTAWATCLIASYAPPNCTVSCAGPEGGGPPYSKPTSGGGLASSPTGAGGFAAGTAAFLGLVAAVAGGW